MIYTPRREATMNRLLLLFVAAFALHPTTCDARDIDVDTLLTFGEGYASGPMGAWTYPLGEGILLYGKVTRINLQAGLPDSSEYTYVIANLISSYDLVWDNFECECGGSGTGFRNGTLSIYRDDTPDADFTAPDTYKDGILLLEATLDDFRSLWGGCRPGCPVFSHGYLVFSGGSLLDLVPIDYNVKGANFLYEYDRGVAQEFTDLGIFAKTTGAAVTYFSIVPVEATTWGHLKSLYKIPR
jgi:hypothetical protein